MCPVPHVLAFAGGDPRWAVQPDLRVGLRRPGAGHAQREGECAECRRAVCHPGKGAARRTAFSWFPVGRTRLAQCCSACVCSQVCRAACYRAVFGDVRKPRGPMTRLAASRRAPHQASSPVEQTGVVLSDTPGMRCLPAGSHGGGAGGGAGRGTRRGRRQAVLHRVHHSQARQQHFSAVVLGHSGSLASSLARKLSQRQVYRSFWWP